MELHVTALKGGQLPELQRCAKCCTLYHCLFCPSEMYMPRARHHVKQHLEIHRKNAVRFEDYEICKCNQPCRNTGHFHCIKCPKTIIRREGFITHLRICNPKTEEDSLSCSAPESPAQTVSKAVAKFCSPLATPQGKFESPLPKEIGASIGVLPGASGVIHKVQCPHCHLVLNRKNLARHISRNHMEESVGGISHRSHLPSQCIDSMNGIYAVAKSFEGPPVPIHVKKGALGEANEAFCEMNNCQLMQIKSYSQGAQCCHLKSVDFCSSEGPTEFLEERTLNEMVSRQWLTPEKKAECLQMQRAALGTNMPLSVQIHIGSPYNKYYVSVYESTMKKYSQFGRVIVAYNSNTNTLNCPCAKLDTCCLHKFICTWHLFQVEEQLFGRGEKEDEADEDGQLEQIEYCMKTMGEMEDGIPGGLGAITMENDREVREACTQTDIEVKGNREENREGCSGKCDISDASTQTDTKVQGHGPRLSKVNLFTLLSLWMELFPRIKSQLKNAAQTRITGLVVVQDQNVIGLHCSSAELHVGQVAVIKHGPRLKGCDLYFSRKPCSTCLKMIVNVSVNRVSYWPGDPELSLLLLGDSGKGSSTDGQAWPSSQDAVLDAIAAERLKSNSRPHICVLLQPLASTMQQFVEETSSSCDFLERIAGDNPLLDMSELFAVQRRQSLEDLTGAFFIPDKDRHRDILAKVGLETFCTEPYFSNLRQHMRDLIGVLASVTSSVPDIQQGYGFYRKDPTGPPQGLSQEIARHCIIQARLLAYRTEDPKVGVGAVIWAEGKSGRCDGTGHMYLVGCGYNAYPAGSEYAEFPQMDTTQEDRQNRKYRYIIHAEQSALIFRSAEIKEEENTMLFVTKCPCDECVPLIMGAGIKQIYTTDLDSGKDKDDISYLRFDRLQGIQKFIWQRNLQAGGCSEPTNPPLSNGCVRTCEIDTEENPCNKKPRF
ncbi:hypothetical protein AAFF_G00211040 [Aldrovandia affinis]|uniref:Cytidine and dCMP deaminase domain-containing protein 1 n=1 Tax=Aldrovandia affinis TaxID=143900 RepID=A0AAD7SWN6_9TELE|nr:hypothetical protein AAFF_G00211040 [Aldrovandia affinis]